jgi:hypothetical protein
VVINDDTGTTDIGCRERPGFGGRLAAVCNGNVGAVFALRPVLNAE